MKMHITNLTCHNLSFSYPIDEGKRRRGVTIAPHSPVTLAQDLGEIDVENIKRELGRYGLIEAASNRDRLGVFPNGVAALCFSIIN